MSDFSDRPLVAGSLTGIRSFRVDGLGRLTGVSYPEVWTPGENTAKCLKDDVRFTSRLYGGLIPASWFGSTVKMTTTNVITVPDATESKPVVEPHHDVASLSCGCGFYAYFDEYANPYHYSNADQVYGLIKGYGVATVGLRGFRCEKAELLALIIKPKHYNALFEKVQRNYSDLPVFTKKREALEKFPLTPQDSLTPETADDFWTPASFDWRRGMTARTPRDRDDLQAVQRESERQRRHVVNLAQEWHTAPEAHLAAVFAEYQALVPNLTDGVREEWWQRLTVAAGEVERLQVIHEYDCNHLARRQASAELPQFMDRLAAAAYGVLVADGNAALAKARATS